MKHKVPFAMLGIVALLVTPALNRTTASAESARPKHSEVVAGGAALSDLHLNRFRKFENFLDNHPAIARDFSRNPLLVDSADFQNRHPQWMGFLTEYPTIHADIRANPGNYVVMGPRAEAAWEQGQRSEHINHTKSRA